ncbi:MAG: L-threonylcarbamoyladenylate synthase [Oscillatoriophycideae cyanobacterium NC_groundwater_1537_Pr4_S-0.65um_50_18]|nr:L-threonylcarbamoyladenylate synthase [Oscillatoriophycideae cyanobacterium NC_groundwater_1537_Pr4_S-0.65um_50_18]
MPSVSLVDLIAAAQLGDRLISFPTDTLPALAARPQQASLIFTAKQRSLTKPLILMAAEAADLWPYVRGSEAEMAIWQQVADRYWPGALTLVLPASDRLPPGINPTDPTTVGLRVPHCAIACHILSQTQPLATTSVNRSGEPPLQTMTEINAQFPEVLTPSPKDLSLFSVPSCEGQPSTVVKWVGKGWEILRQGRIQFEA